MPQDATTDLTNQSYTFVWDGKDAYGRTLQGLQPVTVRIGYVYCGVYLDSTPGPEYDNTFGHFSYYGIPITGSRTREEVTLWQEWQTWFGSPWDARAPGLGAWSLDAHHVYDPVARVLYRGDGSRRSTEGLAMVITTVAGNGTRDRSHQNVPAVDTPLDWAAGIAAGPDGSFYIMEMLNHCLGRVAPDGIINRVAGTGSFGYSGDGGLAVQAQLYDPTDVAVGPDGSLYIADQLNNRIRRVDPDGIITTVAGSGPSGTGGGFSGDGGPATAAYLSGPRGVAVGPDGSLYIADTVNHRIRQVGTDGIITTVAGSGPTGSYAGGFSGDGGPATEALLYTPMRVATGPKGSLYIADTGNQRIRRVGPDGIITTAAGNGISSYGGDGGPATEAQLSGLRGVAVGPDGTLYIADFGNHRVRRVGPGGIITTVAGNGTEGFSGDSGPAAQATLRMPWDVAVAPDGGLYVADWGNNRIRRIAPALPGLSVSDIVIPAEDGSEVYVFDSIMRTGS